MNTNNSSTAVYEEHSAPDFERMDRAALLKEAINLIASLTDEQIKTVFERMRYNVKDYRGNH